MDEINITKRLEYQATKLKQTRKAAGFFSCREVSNVLDWVGEGTLYSMENPTKIGSVKLETLYRLENFYKEVTAVEKDNKTDSKADHDFYLSKKLQKQMGIDDTNTSVVRSSNVCIFKNIDIGSFVMIDNSITTVQEPDVYALSFGDKIFFLPIYPQQNKIEVPGETKNISLCDIQLIGRYIACLCF